MKKTYYSYSRLWTYLRDPEEYYRKYVQGFWDPPTAKMLLGTIFSDAYSERKKAETGIAFDWREALKHPEKYYKNVPEGTFFTPDFERVMDTALNHPKLVRLPSFLCEQTIRVESKICPLLAKNDGFNPKAMLVVENKYGMPWTEDRVESDDQLTFYSYVGYLLKGEIPKIRLQSINRNNGQVVPFETKRKKAQFKPLEEKIEFAYKGITNEVYTKANMLNEFAGMKKY